MELSLLVWLLPTLALVIGVAVGFIVARLLPNAAPSNTQRQLDDIQKRFDSYQNEVVTHFNSTAMLVKKLTQSYQDVQDHLPKAPTAWPSMKSLASACWLHCIPKRRKARVTA